MPKDEFYQCSRRQKNALLSKKTKNAHNLDCPKRYITIESNYSREVNFCSMATRELSRVVMS